MKVQVDPVTLSSVWTTLISIAEEIGIIIRRISSSATVREADDFSAGIFDSNGLMTAQGVFSPAHLGSMPFMLKEILKEFPPETWAPGDCIVANQPWVGAGHCNDIYATVPAFFQNRLVGFLSDILHHIDVGGMRPGSQAISGALDVFADGIQIPPVKLYRKGEANEEVFKIVSANVREPEMVIADLRAQRNVLQHYGVSRLVELFQRYGLETMTACGQEIIERTEEAVRSEIAAIPNGKYCGETYVDDYGPGTPPIKLKVTVEVEDRSIVVDFAGTDPQVPAGLNCYLNWSRAWTIYAINALFRSSVPHNEGGMRPIMVTGPEGCFLNPKKGAPCGGRAATTTPVCELTMHTLLPARPERAIAPYGGLCHGSFGGIDPRSGRRFVGTEYCVGLMGARYNKDGLWTYGPGLPRNIPIEVWETAYPLRVESLEILPDSAGAGKFQGCPAVRKDIRFLADDWSYANLTRRHRWVPAGPDGAKPAMRTSTVLVRGGNQEELEGSGNYEGLRHGDLLRLTAAGSGGWGNPLERDAQMVLDDVIEGYVSVEGARRNYGVVINADMLEVDVEGTERLRASMESR